MKKMLVAGIVGLAALSLSACAVPAADAGEPTSTPNAAAPAASLAGTTDLESSAPVATPVDVRARYEADSEALREPFETITTEFGRVLADMEQIDFEGDFDAAMSEMKEIEQTDFAKLATAGAMLRQAADAAWETHNEILAMPEANLGDEMHTEWSYHYSSILNEFWAIGSSLEENGGRLNDFTIFGAFDRVVEHAEAIDSIEDASDPFAAWG